MKTTMWGHAAPAVRKVLSFAAPALLVGLLLGSHAYGIAYPRAPTGTIERTVDRLLLKEQNDILRESALIRTQNLIGGVIRVLNAKLENTSDPNQRAFIEQQIAQKQGQFNQFGQLINTNTQVLADNLNIVNPAKDRLLKQLIGLRQFPNQASQFNAAARQRELVYATVMKIFLKARNFPPSTGF